MDTKDYINQVGETQFNAGITMVIEIHNIFEQVNINRITKQYSLRYEFLRAAEIKMSPKIRDDKKGGANDLLKELHAKYITDWQTFVRKNNRGNNRIATKLYWTMEQYLTEYEELLLKYRDKFGYGMPDKMSALDAAWR